MPRTEEYLIEAADQLKRAARAIRDLAGNLDDIHDRLLAEPVKIDTDRHKSRRSGDDSDEGSDQ